ncbi:YfhO family protein [Streptomyces sp. CBMA29]|uniref:YfhO family protein n=1 Tax=Streptomyces sp. CBMA29 TaxID=1896314 RepID=UPI001661C7FE|nr:YfhO family protein [Streptomyces sp. CBMA29]MBD0736896.1 hypothetical protein [Streptomyces sp. CBMA29]
MLTTSSATIDTPAAAPPAGPPRRPAPRAAATPLAALLAAAVSMGSYCLALAVHGTYPFGPRSRAVNDLGNQFVPYHAHLWDLMHGRATGDLIVNWGSGYGVPFLADFFTYLMNPFSWLVGLFPRDAVNAAVFTATVLSIGLGAALMTVYLGRLRPGSPWLRALLAVGYAVSTWTVSDGFGDPMWMWGLSSFPLLGIAYDWCLHGRRWVPATLVIALCWAANFYTAAMATLGMGLVLGARLLLDSRPVRDRWRALLRGAAATATGLLLAAPVLTVSYTASKASQPAGPQDYTPPAALDYLAHLLPGGLYPSAPRISVGLLPLLLVLAFPFMRRVPGRERAVWTGLLVLVALSYIWKPTVLLWHGLAMPNGSPYRAAIALTSMLVAVAWLALSRRPLPRELLAGGAALAVLLAVISGGHYFTRGEWILILSDSALVLGLLLLLARHRTDRRVRIGVFAALTCSVFLATAYSVFSISVIRDNNPWWTPRETVSAASLTAHAAVGARDDWPETRTDPGPHQYTDNDPLLLGGEGGSYYSSYLPARTASTLQALGSAWTMRGRHIYGLNDPVGRAIMGVSSSLGTVPGAPSAVAQHTAPAPPVVTLRPGAAFDGAARDTSVFARQQRVLGARVYRVPQLSPASGPRPTPEPNGTWRLPGNAKAAAWTSFTATCAPGAPAYLYAPWFSGPVRANGAAYRAVGVHDQAANGIIPLGAVPASGRIRLALGTTTAQDIPRFPVGCLDQGALRQAVAKLRATGPVEVTAGGHTIAATFRRGSHGTAVLAVPAVTGWRCSVDGGAPAVPRTLGGLIAVDLGGGSRVSCSFRTPGLNAGLPASGLALAVLLAVGVGGRFRDRSGRNGSSATAGRTLTRRLLPQRLVRDGLLDEPALRRTGPGLRRLGRRA